MESLPPTLRRDGLPVETEFVAPVLALERPDDVLFVRLHDVPLRLLHGDLGARDRGVELVALRRGDVDEDLRAVAEMLVELVEVPLVALARDLPGVADSDVARELAGVLDVVAERRA